MHWSSPAVFDKPIRQVVESIAWCIMIGNEVPSHPWFNEPGFSEGYEQTNKLNEFQEALSATYNREIRRCNIKICMIDTIKYPPLGFADAIKEHFCAKGDVILEKVRKWEAEDTEDDFQEIYQLREEAKAAYSAEQLQQVLTKMNTLRDALQCNDQTPTELMEEFEQDVTKAQERIAQMVEAEASSLDHEADSFMTRVKHLRELLSQGVDLDETEIYDPATTEAAAAAAATWHWSNDDSSAVADAASVTNWEIYDAEQAEQLEIAYAADPTGQCDLTIGETGYTVSFSDMVQTRASNQTKRYVKREEPTEDVEDEAKAVQFAENLQALKNIAEHIPDEVCIPLLSHLTLLR